MPTDTRLSSAFFMYAAVLLFLAIGAGTLPQLDWYQTLTLPAFALPPFVVSAAWLIVFLSGGLSLAVFWQNEPTPAFLPILAGYGTIAALLIAWNYLFFGAGLLAPAALIALLITALVALLMLLLRREAPRAALMLLPFFIWMLYASWFNHVLSVLNPG